jgi:hypothetical protein
MCLLAMVQSVRVSGPGWLSVRAAADVRAIAHAVEVAGPGKLRVTHARVHSKLCMPSATHAHRLSAATGVRVCACCFEVPAAQGVSSRHSGAVQHVVWGSAPETADFKSRLWLSQLSPATKGLPGCPSAPHRPQTHTLQSVTGTATVHHQRQTPTMARKLVCTLLVCGAAFAAAQSQPTVADLPKSLQQLNAR